MTRLRLPAVLAVSAALLLTSGCGAPASPDTATTPESPPAASTEALTCDEFAGVITESLPLLFVLFDTDVTAPEVAETMRELSDRWNGVTPPEPIAGDWPAIATWADDYATAWEALPADADIQDSIASIEAELGDEEAAYEAAMENVTTYVDAECPQE